MTLTIFATINLALLVITAGLGLTAFISWLQHRDTRLPVVKLSTHIFLQAVAILLWLIFVISDILVFAWLSFGILTLGQVFGDLLMFASFRSRNSNNSQLKYLSVARDVLGFKRPVPGFHALIGAVSWFGMLAICIIATATR